MVDFNLNPATATSAHDKVLQDKVHAAQGRILHVMQVVGNHPTAHESEKIQHLENLADLNEGYLTGQVTVPVTAPAALPAGTTTPPGTTPASPNAADQQRIAELEGGLADLAYMLGIYTIPSSSGKIDVNRLKQAAQTAIDDMRTAPWPATNLVDKSSVATVARQIRLAADQLRSGALRGNRIDGLDTLHNRIDELDQLAR